MIYVVDTGDGVAASDHIPSLSPDTYTSNGMCTNNNGKNWQPVNWIMFWLEILQVFGLKARNVVSI